MDCYSATKKNNWYRQWPGWIPGVMLSEKNQSQRLHPACVHLPNILEKTKGWKWRTDSFLPQVKERAEVGQGVSMAMKGQREGSWGERNALHLHCIGVVVLVVTLYYWFVRCYHWRKLGEGHLGSLCIISHNCISVTIISSLITTTKFSCWIS